MSTSRHIDKICLAAAIAALLLTAVFLNGERLGIQSAAAAMGYETRLFDTSTVHTIEIVMDDWDSFIETCENEEYAVCSVVIDNEAYKNVGIRAKGNTSLSSVSQLGSQRYSFKIEFDQYDSGKSYYGLDKLCLNNLIQDNTMMKDYLTYQMMAEFGVDAPLCSFVYITVNGEDWGLYLAVEGVEDAFLQRNYGSGAGELYKPDSTSMGGGPGNGREFDMDDFAEQFGEDFFAAEDSTSDAPSGDFSPESRQEERGGRMPETVDPFEADAQADADSLPEQADGDMARPADGGEPPDMPEDMGGRAGGGGFDGGMGSDDVKLQYVDDDPDSYSNIFDSAKTDVSDADQQRLIAALKALSEGDVESSVNIDEVLRYFVVHNFVVNGDSYTGSMIHNYYLYEQDGLLSMIPWDYNLAFGGFQSSSASSTVNDPIDTPLSITGDGTRPMADWIFQSEAYTALYHQYFSEFLETVDITGIIDEAYGLIASYVERDPTKFCTYEEFELGVSTLREFCQLRAESVSGQLDGTIPSTTSGQSADSSTLIDASAITISDMGSMNNTMGGGGFAGGRGESREPGRTGQFEHSGASEAEEVPDMTESPEMPVQEGTPPDTDEGGGQENSPAVPDTGTEGASAPEGQQPQQGGGDRPEQPGRMQQGQGSGQSGSSTWILLGASLMILLLGVAIAYKYRR